jgi:metallophosphoesterase superfamily enzyme
MLLHNEWKLTAGRFAFHLPTRSAIIADMHLGYIAARRNDGEAIPHFGETERLDMLLPALQSVGAQSLIIAGDAVETGPAGFVLLDQWVAQLHEAHLTVHLVPGNHDQHLPPIPHLEVHPDGYSIGNWLILHDVDLEDDRRIIQGHLHPCLRSALVAGEAPCYLHTLNRLLLPAWCDHAAGINVLSMVEWQHANCSAVVGENVLALGPVSILRRKLSRRARPFRIGFGLST